MHDKLNESAKTKSHGQYQLVVSRASLTELKFTESEKIFKFNTAVPLGITHSKHLCLRKPAKNE